MIEKDVYYYAHLSGCAAGIGANVPAGKGQLVGWVGTIGNVSSPNLHPGLMPGSLNLATLQNPYPLMTELCRGTGQPHAYRESR